MNSDITICTMRKFSGRKILTTLAGVVLSLTFAVSAFRQQAIGQAGERVDPLSAKADPRIAAARESSASSPLAIEVAGINPSRTLATFTRDERGEPIGLPCSLTSEQDEKLRRLPKTAGQLLTKNVIPNSLTPQKMAARLGNARHSSASKPRSAVTSNWV